jgi:hypothetical protein
MILTMDNIAPMRITVQRDCRYVSILPDPLFHLPTVRALKERYREADGWKHALFAVTRFEPTAAAARELVAKVCAEWPFHNTRENMTRRKRDEPDR